MKVSGFLIKNLFFSQYLKRESYPYNSKCDELEKSFELESKNKVIDEMHRIASDDELLTDYQRSFAILDQNLKNIARNTMVAFLNGFALTLNAKDDVIKPLQNDIVSCIRVYVYNYTPDVNMPCSKVVQDCADHTCKALEELSKQYRVEEIKIQNAEADDTVIKCLYVPVGKEPEVVFIPKEKSLEQLQELVGGYIQCLPFYSPTNEQIDLVCNDEGKLMNLPMNRYLRTSHFDGDKENCQIYDYLAGDGIVMASNEEGEWVSLSDEAICYWSEEWREPEDFFLGKYFLQDENVFDELLEESYVAPPKEVISRDDDER